MKKLYKHLTQSAALLCLATGLSLTAMAQTDSTATATKKDRYPLVIDYSLLDLPFQHYGAHSIEGGISKENANASANFYNALQFKSPEQAAQITNNIMQSGHWAITYIPVFKNHKNLNFATRLLITGVFDFMMQEAPYGPGYVHEEGHRTVMANSYVYSYNPFVFKKASADASGGSVHSVSYVLDTNLVMMKADNNANFVRLSTAGGEMTVYSTSKQQQANFFYAPERGNKAIRPISSLNYFFNLLNFSAYVKTCSNKEELAKTTNEQIEREGANQELRDFTGMDFAAWIYDLNRPDEPYSNRGLNKYGNGYDRYIYGNKLTDEEYDWLKKQANLSYINFISPSMIFIDQIWINENTAFNFSGRYYPTSFGNQIGVEFLLKTPKYNIFVAPHLNQNKDNNFVGIEAMLFEKPFSMMGQTFLGTARIVADAQPRNQRFTESSGAFTGLIGGQVSWKASKVIYPFLSLEGKTKGWIAGNAFLNEQFSVKVGLSARFNYSMKSM